MVLSSYSDWGTDVQNAKSEPIHLTRPVQDQLVVADHRHFEYYWDAFELPYAFLDPYIDPNSNILHPENYTPLLPYCSPYDPLISFSPEIDIPYGNFSSYPCSKRQKLIEDHYCSDFMPSFFDGVAPSSCLPVPEDQGMYQINLEGNVENCKKTSERCVSVQSIAARERRRKITEKTQELGKLVPGGNKMNTAEMLQAAFKYIKYLQAQVGILQVMDSFSENEKAAWKENMQIVISQRVQQKLYMEDKCLVPKDIVLSLTALSKPPLSVQLSRLLALAPHH
ncbi:transcription factor bHLH53-like [Durio zibethinus]|uniref:Transcription factor bHLH53-like n=1 Tax=Durio zibethinus TaxID=66656 RepID=A0A6P5WQR4_DURZI|nr:transcription factor bHLH53-like [Durio zibethinus]